MHRLLHAVLWSLSWQRLQKCVISCRRHNGGSINRVKIFLPTWEWECAAFGKMLSVIEFGLPRKFGRLIFLLRTMSRTSDTLFRSTWSCSDSSHGSNLRSVSEWLRKKSEPTISHIIKFTMNATHSKPLLELSPHFELEPWGRCDPENCCSSPPSSCGGCFNLRNQNFGWTVRDKRALLEVWSITNVRTNLAMSPTLQTVNTNAKSLFTGEVCHPFLGKPNSDNVTITYSGSHMSGLMYEISNIIGISAIFDKE